MKRRKFLGILGAMPLILQNRGISKDYECKDDFKGKQDSIIKKDSINLVKAKQEINSNLFKGEIMIQEYMQTFYNGSHPLQNIAGEYFSRHITFAAEATKKAEQEVEKSDLVKLLLGSLIALDAKSEYERVLKSSLDSNISAIEASEICFQATPYIGFARASVFVESSYAIFEKSGVIIPLPNQSVDSRERAQLGLEAQRKIFGEAIDRGSEATPHDEKHIRDYLQANCFGDYYTRKGLKLEFRELLTFVFLSAMGGVQPQLIAHASGNLHIGNNRAKLIAVVSALIPFIGYPKALNAISAIDEASKNLQNKEN